MPRLTEGHSQQSELLSLILKTIRRERRMKGSEVAAAMGVALKTYENFEAGRGRLDLEKIRLFAEATRSDAVAIVLALLFGSLEIALRAMDNKISTILWIALREFGEDVGDAMSGIPGTAAFEAFRHAFKELADLLRRRDDAAERWLEQEISRLYRPPSSGDEEL